MNAAEIESNIKKLAQLADELLAASNAPERDGMARVVAGLGYVLTSTAKLVAECKIQLDEAAVRERRRDKSATATHNEDALRTFARLKPEDRERLVRSVETSPPNVSVEAFAAQVALDSKCKGWQVTRVLRWVEAYYSYLAQRENEEDVNQITEILIDPYDAEPETVEVLKAVDSANLTSPFTQLLKRLLRCHSTLGVTSKAEMLLSRNERQFAYATVSTDLRPIFGGNVESAPPYGVVLHNLVVGMNDGGNKRVLGLTLTSKDILNLADVLNRAWKKEQTLRNQNAYKLLPLK